LRNNPSDEQTKAAVKRAIQIVRESRGVIMTAVEAKATTKRKKAAINPQSLLDNFIGGETDSPAP